MLIKQIVNRYKAFLLLIVSFSILILYFSILIYLQEPEKEVWPFDNLESSMTDGENVELLYSNKYKDWKIFCKRGPILDNVVCYLHNRIYQYDEVSLFIPLSLFDLREDSLNSIYIFSPLQNMPSTPLFKEVYVENGSIKVGSKGKEYKISVICDKNSYCEIGPFPEQLISELKIGTIANLYLPKPNNDGYHAIQFSLFGFSDVYNHAEYQLQKHNDDTYK